MNECKCAVIQGIPVKSPIWKTKNYVETHPDVWAWVDDPPTYYIRSTILGGEVVSDVNSTGEKLRTYVRAAGMELAWQNKTPQTETVVFQHQDASGTSYRTTGTDGTMYTGEGSEGGPAELDPLGGNVGNSNPYLQQVPGNECDGCEMINTEMPMYVNGQPLRFNRDGMYIPMSVFIMLTDGHQFDILQQQARASIRFAGYSLRFNNGDEQFAGYDFDGAVGQMEGGETLIRNWFVSDSWAVNLSMIPIDHQQAQQRQDRGDLPDWVKEIYRDKKLAKKLTDCINKIFNAKSVTVTRDGSTFEVLGGAALQGQKIANAPYVDEASFSRFVLAGGTGKRAYGAVFHSNVYDYATAKQRGYIPGTVYIANDITDTTVNGRTFTAKQIMQKAYIHELGNILSVFLTGDGNYFGEPEGVPMAANPAEKDKDTGAALEKCVYNTPQLIP